MTARPLAVDVLVAGGGMAGTVAALAAARSGASVLLAERWGFLGGAATAAAVGQFVGWETASGRRVVRGMAAWIVSALAARGGAGGHEHFVMSTGHRMDRVCYDVETLKVLLDDEVTAAGVKVLFHSLILDVTRAGRRITGARLVTKAGLIAVAPRVVIDATGELDLLARASATFLPLEAGEQLQPGTLMFRFGPIDYVRFDAIPQAEREALAARGVACGALARAALHQSRVPGTNDGWFNISRIAVDATDPFDLGRAEMTGRRQATDAAAYLRAQVPGCEAGRVVALAPQLGIRESRRVEGRYVLTADDLRHARRFEDTVAMGAYPIDVHPAQGAGLRFEPLGEDVAYSIPYRALVPRTLDNALVAGRGISATHEAHAAVRVMPIAMAIGEAAGVAAALTKMNCADVPITELRARLRASDAYLE